MKIDIYTREHDSPEWDKRRWEQVAKGVDSRFGWLRLLPDDVLKELVFGWENDETYLDFGLCHAIDRALSAEVIRRRGVPDGER